MPESAPEGFEPHDRRSPLTSPWEPIYRRQSADAVILGLRVGERHCNGRGFAHGGLISTLADNAMGLTALRQVGEAAGLVTVNLNVDFLTSAQIGQWLEFETEFVKPGGTLAFTQAYVTADGEPCARANAVFKVVRRTTS